MQGRQTKCIQGMKHMYKRVSFVCLSLPSSQANLFYSLHSYLAFNTNVMKWMKRISYEGMDHFNHDDDKLKKWTMIPFNSI